jgi:4-amino-4-deoxychorismate lyase
MIPPRRDILVDGRPGDVLPADDRGLLYGDGVFRTLRVDAGQPRWWDDQLAKLSRDCASLGLIAPQPVVWRADLRQLAPPPADGILKLLVTRGSGARGYQPPDPAHTRRLMVFEALEFSPNPPAGLRLRICALRLGWQPRLAGVKHLNRLENVLARAEWDTPEIDEGLLLDQAGNVISGVMSNLFIWRGNRLLTPRLDRCGVAGVARARLMQRARDAGIEVQETELDLPAVYEADEVMLTNSVRGLRRVARLEAKHWPNSTISRQLTEYLDA